MQKDVHWLVHWNGFQEDPEQSLGKESQQQQLYWERGPAFEPCAPHGSIASANRASPVPWPTPGCDQAEGSASSSQGQKGKSASYFCIKCKVCAESHFYCPFLGLESCVIPLFTEDSHWIIIPDILECCAGNPWSSIDLLECSPATASAFEQVAIDSPPKGHVSPLEVYSDFVTVHLAEILCLLRTCLYSGGYRLLKRRILYKIRQETQSWIWYRLLTDFGQASIDEWIVFHRNFLLQFCASRWLSNCTLLFLQRSRERIALFIECKSLSDWAGTYTMRWS